MDETSLRELRSLPEKELIDRCEFLRERAGVFFIGGDDYWKELDRRETARQNEKVESLTVEIKQLTSSLVRLTMLLTFGTVILVFDALGTLEWAQANGGWTTLISLIIVASVVLYVVMLILSPFINARR